MSLKNATVVILGGSSGIGLATAKAARAEGAQVIITGRSAQRLQTARAELADAVRTVALDVADETGTRSFFQELDHLDHVFITAGTLIKDSRLAPESATLQPAMDTRFWGALYAAKYGAQKMNGSGSITFMSGTAATRPLGGMSVASASCGAVEAFARALAVDLAPIRVNTIQPGFVDTPLLDEFLGAQRAEILAAAARRLPVRRIGQPEDIADAVLFLMKNGYVTGITLTIDGGGLLV
ncbi:MAG TPA: SDR family oxidoreductase [Candidatus Binatia bacterium]|jgi:NAD(P)-dependent dehydrogenase (short-subunit alcohol dehydrogenase family)|nr:SDR family oxidoreductase [Candidatus Binatia bacterium]